MKFRTLHTLLIATAACLAIATTTSAAFAAHEDPKPINFVVLLDLSDRLLENDGKQAETDIEAILAGFDRFEEQCRRDYFVKAKHKFKVAALPQKDTPQALIDLLGEVEINMAAVQPGKRRAHLEGFKSRLEKNLVAAYKIAFRGTKSNDYPGTDIWKYFNDRLLYDLDGDYRNQVMVITDGYFDFEPGAALLTGKTRSTATSAYHRKYRSKADWRNQIAAAEEGLLPVDGNDTPFELLVFGLSTKHNAVNEEQLLMYFWTDWGNLSGFSPRFAPNSKAPSNLALVKRFCRSN